MSLWPGWPLTLCGTPLVVSDGLTPSPLLFIPFLTYCSTHMSVSQCPVQGLCPWHCDRTFCLLRSAVCPAWLWEPAVAGPGRCAFPG